MPESDICDVCNKRVLDDEDGLQCDKCLKWKHRVCLSIGQKTYFKLAKSKEPWHCTSCKQNKNERRNAAKKDQPTPTYTIADVMAKLEDMDEKYNKLFLKYKEQVEINNELREELSQIKRQLNKNEQRELNKNITIHGVEYKANENVKEIVTKIGEKLQIHLKTEEFAAARLGRNQTGRNPIKVIFQSEETKTKILQSKLIFGLNNQSLGYTETNKIYLNHDLTKRNLQIFKEAQTFKKENAYKFLWINGGNILLKKDENSKVILVEKEEDLKN